MIDTEGYPGCNLDLTRTFFAHVHAFMFKLSIFENTLIMTCTLLQNKTSCRGGSVCGVGDVGVGV